MIKQKRLYIQIFAESHQVINFGEFERYAVFISNLYTFNLPAVVIKRTQKLLIEFSQNEDALPIFPKEQGESIYTIKEKFDFLKFNNASSANKKSILTEAVYQCLYKLYVHLALNTNDVELACKQITNNNFELKLPLCGGIKSNKHKTTKACVLAAHYLDYALIQIHFVDHNDVLIYKFDLFKTVPVYYIYIQLTNSAKWINNDVFTITNNSKEFTVHVKINGSYSIAYNPNLRTVDDIKEEIQFLTKDTLIHL